MGNARNDKHVIYKKVFGNEYGRQVIEDLNIFCNGTRTHNTNDPMELMRLEGRREVLLQIMTVMKIDVSALFDEYTDDHIDF